MCNRIATWFDRLTMSGCAPCNGGRVQDEGGTDFHPHPNPLPSRERGSFDGLRMRGGGDARLVHYEAAIDVDGLAGDVARARAGQESRHRGNVFGFVGPADGNIGGPLRL